MNFIITRYDLGPGFFPSSPPPNIYIYIYIYIPSKNQQVFLSRPHTRPTLVRNPKFIEIISKYYKYPMLKQSQGPNLTFFGFNLGRLLITSNQTSREYPYFTLGPQMKKSLAQFELSSLITCDQYKNLELVRFLSRRCSFYFKTGEKFAHLF